MMIKPSAIKDYLNRELDDWDWLKKVPVPVLKEELVDLGIELDFTHDPYQCQLVFLWISACLDRFVFLYPMSSGKTASAYNAIRLKINEGKVKKALVLVPRIANIQSWIDEKDKHAPELKAVPIVGTTEEKRLSLGAEADVYITTYGALMYLMCTTEDVSKMGSGRKQTKWKIKDALAKKVTAIFDMVIADELHKVRNHESLIFRCFRKMSHEVEFAYGMTGTPADEPEDLWSQFYAIDKGETFGTTLGMFRAAFYTETRNHWGRVEYTFMDKMKDALQSMLKHRSLAYGDTEVKELPAHRFLKVKLRWSDSQLETYKQLESGMIAARGDFQQMENCYVRMRMLCSGFIDWKDPVTGKKERLKVKDNPKLDWIEGFIEDLRPDEKVVLFHKYTGTGTIITELLTKHKKNWRWIHGDSKTTVQDYSDFRRDDDVQFMVINVQSGDAGLQFEMAKYCILVESPESSIDRSQVIKRVWRSGDKETEVSVIIDLMMAGSVEVNVVDDAENGKNFMDRLIHGKKPSRKLRRR